MDADRKYWKAFVRQELPIVVTLGRYLIKDQYIFCEKEFYRYYIMPYMRAHALGAYKSMDYYQLSGPVAEAMERDYQVLMSSGDMATLDSLTARYNIRTAVASFREFDKPSFQAFATHWRKIYADKYIAIYRKPG
jgi:hypothetical protein